MSIRSGDALWLAWVNVPEPGSIPRIAAFTKENAADEYVLRNLLQVNEAYGLDLEPQQNGESLTAAAERLAEACTRALPGLSAGSLPIAVNQEGIG